MKKVLFTMAFLSLVGVTRVFSVDPVVKPVEVMQPVNVDHKLMQDQTDKTMQDMRDQKTDKVVPEDTHFIDTK